MSSFFLLPPAPTSFISTSLSGPLFRKTRQLTSYQLGLFYGMPLLGPALGPLIGGALGNVSLTPIAMSVTDE